MIGVAPASPVSSGSATARRWTFALGALVLAALLPGPGAAQTYPAKPITLVVPFAPGGPTDASARAIAQALGPRLGQQMVVENRAGGGGTVGPMAVVRAAPDGYTLLWAGTSSLAMGPALYPKLAYDPIKSFTPISQAVRSPHVLVGRGDLPAKTLPDLIALVKSQPGKLTYGSAGTGSSTHLTGELFESTFGVDLLHIGYSGVAPALNDLLGKQIDLLFDAVSTLRPHIRSGALVPYGITGQNRSPMLPEVPTIAEMLHKPFDAYSWFGLVAPAGTPPDIVAKLTRELSATLADPTVRGQLEAAGFEVLGTTSEEFAQSISSELKKWTAVVQRTGIKNE
ncbi:Tripartite tricarboxylate transporter family receptor [Pigmentiphaga humi]|uniref:Tripartite tricarboxylate transporter family receptor n=1 Tax=Pigmentiphaga humi TaxID=2478468 RepID=A0A3P4B281_9BURK|nr:tripartite tricarboxylate transporter substrate binding protein [Pigmentiphaga humi]VCU69991.1 Tripartite tricarboxylate transporter family receptor [Pigmentiphaga humi]